MKLESENNMKVTKKIIYQVEDFALRFKPIEDSINISKIKEGFCVKYLTLEDYPINPREDTNYSKMICFHKRYDLGDKTDLKSEMFNSRNELYNHLKRKLKAIIILPLYLYEHSNISIKIGSFKGLLPQGHYEFDSGQVGFIYLTKQGLKNWGIKKSQVEKYLIQEVEMYNQYLQGNVYSLVREDFDENKKSIEFDTFGGYFGYNEALEALKIAI
jgi:hypothetical protein